MELDAYDKKILRLLQQDNKMSQRSLAEQVNLSASAVNRRIANLEALGVIMRNTSIVDPIKLGRSITIIVEVKIEKDRLDLIDEDKKRFSNCPQVQQVYYVTGDFDFLLVMNVRDMGEYEQLSRELFFKPENIKGFKTIIVMQNAKQNLDVIID